MIGALEEDPEQVQMFLHEARLAAALTHPRVVQIFELGEHEGSFFIVMEFLDGESVWAVWKEGHHRSRHMPDHLLAQVIAEAAEGLHYAHTRTGEDGQVQPIVHRDVSPQNLLVTYDGGVKVVDFGIAKVGTAATTSGKLKGKLAYMSPEQGRGEALDPRSDVFALGVVLFEMVTHTRLFPRLPDLEILKLVMTGTDLPTVDQRRPDAPEGLKRIIGRAMAAEREQRYQNAREFQLALQDFVVELGHRSTSADVADHMQALFGERIAQRRTVIESARRGELNLGQVPDRLFPVASGSNPSSKAGPTPAASRSDLTPVLPARRRWPMAAGVVVALAIVAAFALQRAPAPPEVTPARAALSVDSRPQGAHVQLDSVGRGVTPLELTGLDEGAHELTLSLEGHASQKRSVALKASERLSVVVDLDPLARPAEAPVDAGHRPDAPPVARVGKLSLDTTPWSTVYLGTRRLGETPLTNVALPAGRQVLRLVNPEQNLNSSIEVDIVPNEVTVKNLMLQ
jgi:serine/threonine-protein kinase